MTTKQYTVLAIISSVASFRVFHIVCIHILPLCPSPGWWPRWESNPHTAYVANKADIFHWRVALCADRGRIFIPVGRGLAPAAYRNPLEPQTGVEPAFSAWEADVLPLYDCGIFSIPRLSPGEAFFTLQGLTYPTPLQATGETAMPQRTAQLVRVAGLEPATTQDGGILLPCQLGDTRISFSRPHEKVCNLTYQI